MTDIVKMEIDHMDSSHSCFHLVDHIKFNGERCKDNWFEIHIKEGWGIRYKPGNESRGTEKVHGKFELFIERSNLP